MFLVKIIQLFFRHKNPPTGNGTNLRGIYTEIKTNPVKVMKTGHSLMVFNINNLRLFYSNVWIQKTLPPKEAGFQQNYE